MGSLRGINLGGWLVLERWIAPSVFHNTSAADEHSLCLELGQQEATKRLRVHRQTFITEDHIRRIAEMGFETVRLPVGYWLFGDEGPYIDGADAYVGMLFEWAKSHGVKVILDVHAVPGSQNGWDHSGKAGEIGWHKDQENIDRTLAFVRELCERYGGEPTLVGIEPLNEPHWDIPLKSLVDYYRRAGDIIRELCPGNVEVIVSDSFRANEMNRALRRLSLDYTLDMHLYQLFTPEDTELDLQGHIAKVATEWSDQLRGLTRRRRVIVGEWSAAMPESSTADTDTTRHYTKDDYKTYFQAERNLFEKLGVRHVYWTARTEDRGVWSLLDHPDLL